MLGPKMDPHIMSSSSSQLSYTTYWCRWHLVSAI